MADDQVAGTFLLVDGSADANIETAGVFILADGGYAVDVQVAGIFLMFDDGGVMDEPEWVHPYEPKRIVEPVVCTASLRGKKVPWAHQSKTLHRPGWLGKNVSIKSTG